ncbi:P-loop containing nucleoside triphosphate hydrolase protein [Mycena floridula]|nr:P-loop containing nucleoside triphosphate hydrolase protein [Mycena floridula]
MSIQPPPNDLFAAWFSHRGTSSSEVRSWALDAPIDQLKRRFLQLDPRLQTLIPNEYLRTLSTSHLTRALRYIFVCWHVTGETQCLTKLQIEAALGLWAKNDVFMVAGTGQGKTLAGMLNQLLDDTDGITASQASGVKSTYRLETLIVNEDTPRNTEFWQEKAHDIPNKRPGTAQVIIATPEQFFRSPEGHFTKLGELVRHDRFKKRIQHVVVDEIHQLVTQGLARHGLPAFRPCYGRLDELKSLLGDKVSWLVLTATAPLYMVKSFEICTLRPHYLFLRTTSNRSNLTYARNCVDNLKDPKNYRCFIKEPFDLDTQPTVFSSFMNIRREPSTLPMVSSTFYPRNIVTKGSFDTTMAPYPDDICKILVTTSAESTGIDFSHVDIVCSAGLPDFLTLVIQEYGRVVRHPGTQGLAVLFYEPWVKNIELAEYDSKSVEDLDRPRNSPLRLQASAHERVSLSAVKLTQPGTCQRQHFADYLGDTTLEALTFANKFCCDGHDNGFDLRDFLPGPLSVDSPPVSSEDEAPEPVSAPKRPVKQKKELKTLIQIWLSSASVGDRYHFARPRYLILMESQIAALLIPPAGELTTVQDLTRLLDQSDDWESMWAASLLQVIVGYDKEVNRERSVKTMKARKVARKRIQPDENEAPFHDTQPAKRSGRRRTAARRFGEELEEETANILMGMEDSEDEATDDSTFSSKQLRQLDCQSWG